MRGGRLVPLLFALLGEGPPALAGAAADVLAAILAKRMDAGAKLALVRQLGVVPLLARWAAGLPGGGDGGSASGGAMNGGSTAAADAGAGDGAEEEADDDEGEEEEDEEEGADELELKCAQLLATLANGAPRNSPGPLC